MTIGKPNDAEIELSSCRLQCHQSADLSVLKQLLEESELQQLFQSFYGLQHIPLTIIDLDGNLLISSHWQNICAHFHRSNEQTTLACVESDRNISRLLDAGKDKVVQACPHGLTDCAAPIILEGRHIANVFIGQFLTDEPDRERFREQATRYGFDTEAYLHALDNLPIVAPERIDAILDFLSRMTRLITRMGADRKKAIEAEARFRSYFDLPLVGMATTSVDKGFIAVNSRICDILGYSSEELMSMDWSQITHPDDLGKDVELFRQMLAGTIDVYTIDKRFIRKDGRVIWTRISVGCVRKNDGTVDYLCGVMEDISERKAAQEAIQIAEREYREIFENAPEGIFKTSPEGKSIALNPAGARMLGFASSEEGIAAITDSASIAWYDPEDRVAYTRELEARGEIRAAERRFKLRDGSPIWVSITARKITDQAGRTLYYQGFFEDINERKSLEIRAATHLRELSILSAMNAALLSARTEHELLEEYCRILVEIGGYRMAWVGLAEESPEKQLVPVAWAGNEDGYLSAIKVMWDDGPLSHGAGGQAIRSGKIMVAEDIAAAPGMSPFAEEARKRGYASSIAVPFQISAGRMACMTAYGVVPNEWNQAERRLMEQVAAALGYGIRTLRDAIAKERYQRDLSNSLEQTIQVIADTVDQRDPYTAGHQRRVADLCVQIAKKMDMECERIRGLHLAASIHDVGKIGVPAEILAKPGKLTPMQYGLIMEHAQLGYELVRNVHFPWPIADMIRQHHEHMDGSGYPQGLAGEALLLESRILAIADVVEAISTHRPYRPALGIEVALDEILEKRGVWYDAEAVDACIRVFREDSYSLPV